MKITYRGTIDEALETFWGGRRWEANVPQEVTDKDGWDIEENELFTLPNGEIRRITQKRRISMLEAAKRNPSFDVEDEPPKKMERRLRPAKFPNAANETDGDIYIGPNT